MDQQHPSRAQQVFGVLGTVQQMELLHKVAGDTTQLGELFSQHRDRLNRIVNAALDQRVRVRIDASDVIQETFLEAFARINEYLDSPKVSLFVWLRFLAKQRLAMLHRKHLRVQGRDVRRELSLWLVEDNPSSRVQLGAQLAARLTTASATLSRIELKREIQDGLDQLDSRSREVLMLRHFEQLSNVETAEVLQITTTAACNRYVRALERLKNLLSARESRS